MRKFIESESPLPPNGIYILATNNKYYKENEWTQSNDNAVGVAVIADEAKFVIAPKDEGAKIWGEMGKTITGVTNASSSEQAKLDFNGEKNTTQIISQDSAAEAAKYCRNYTFKNGKKGYLGAGGEWDIVYKYINDINVCLSKIGGVAIETNFWTSTPVSANDAWIMMPNYGVVAYTGKPGSFGARPFSSL